MEKEGVLTLVGAVLKRTVSEGYTKYIRGLKLDLQLLHRSEQ